MSVKIARSLFYSLFPHYIVPLPFKRAFITTELAIIIRFLCEEGGDSELTPAEKVRILTSVGNLVCSQGLISSDVCMFFEKQMADIEKFGERLRGTQTVNINFCKMINSFIKEGSSLPPIKRTEYLALTALSFAFITPIGKSLSVDEELEKILEEKI